MCTLKNIGLVHTNMVLFENTYFSLHFGLPSTLRYGIFINENKAFLKSSPKYTFEFSNAYYTERFSCLYCYCACYMQYKLLCAVYTVIVPVICSINCIYCKPKRPHPL